MKPQFLKRPILISRFLSPSDIRRLEKKISGARVTPSTVFREDKGSFYSRHRNTRSMRLIDAVIRDRAFVRIRELNKRHWQVSGPLSRPSMQYIEYSVGSFFDWHVDAPFYSLVNLNTRTDRLFTGVVLLSKKSDFAGGALELYDYYGKLLKPRLEQGQLLLFPSTYYHRVLPVTRGTRRILVIWCRGPSIFSDARKKGKSGNERNAKRKARHE